MLASALNPERQGALRASIAAEYPGLPPLRTILTGRTDVDALDLADYVAHLPLGCALYRASGGPLAWTTDVHMLSHVLHGLDILTWQNTGIMTRNPKGSQPVPMEPPKSVAEARAAEARVDAKRERRDLRRQSRMKLRATD
jgi:hypothetical protein